MSDADTLVLANDQAVVEYRSVPGFAGYRAGSDGTIWSCWKKVGRGKGQGKGSRQVMADEWHQIKPVVNWRARKLQIYLRAAVGVQATLSVGRVVLLSFVGPCPPGLQCCHRDDDLTNNRVDNLRWDTCLNNYADRRTNGGILAGERSVTAVLANDDVRRIIGLLKSGDLTHAKIAALFGVSRRTVGMIARRQTWRHIWDEVEIGHNDRPRGAEVAEGPG